MFEVLIVEDDPMVAMINKQYVSENPHFHVTATVGDGDSAYEYLKTHTVHLVILDKYMPNIDGLTLLRKLREEGITVSVIMVTAANDTASVEEALSLGIVDYLVKPFFNSRFQQALEKFLGRQDAFHDLSSMSQQNIDSLLGSGAGDASELPKGIQAQTLDAICGFMAQNSDKEMTGDYIADNIGLSRVTVRRYMNHLINRGTLTGRMNYETGGRPSMLYKWNS